MKTQFKISYLTATGLKGIFFEFHTSENFDTQIQGGYMKDVTEVKVEATGFTTENIEDAKLLYSVELINQLNGGPILMATQDQLDALGVSEFGYDGVHYEVTSVNGMAVPKGVGEHNVPYVSKTFYPN